MPAPDLKSDLVGHLDRLNQAVLHKLEGLSEYELRRPMTPTATNLLGVAFRLASLQAEYFGETFGRPFPREDEFYFRTDENADPQDDLWVRPGSMAMTGRPTGNAWKPGPGRPRSRAES